MKRDPLVWFAGLRERYGGLAALRLGPVRYLGVNDPDLIRQVLVDDARGYSQFAVHRDARFWRRPEPERFDPERWLDPAAARVPRGAFFPFGDGPRRCIGEHFARAEAGIVMATLARTWSLARVTHSRSSWRRRSPCAPASACACASRRADGLEARLPGGVAGTPCHLPPGRLHSLRERRRVEQVSDRVASSSSVGDVDGGQSRVLIM